jgi:hypothetical protein
VLLADEPEMVVAAAATERRSEAGKREIYIMTEDVRIFCWRTRDWSEV